MKTLTLTQPWSSLVMLGQKTVETRSWRTSYRGPLAIHAAKGFPASAKALIGTPPFREALCDVGRNGMVEWWGKDVVDCLPLGSVIATCQLVDIVPTQQVAMDAKVPRGEVWRNVSLPGIEIVVGHDEWLFGDYSAGRFAWVLENIQPLAEPVPAKGALSLWNWEGF